jgi:predicted transcriptional regulator of viral defense system
MADTLRATEAAQHGLSRTTLYRRAHQGRFDRIARGLYRASDAEPADWDLIEAAKRRPDAIMCLTSALSHHDLIDDIPDAADMAIPRPSRIPSTAGAIRWHLFDAASFELGRLDFPIPGSDLTIGIYSAERCIVDAFRLRGSQGYETGRDALREWLRRGGKPARLMELANQVPRATTPLAHALEYLA